MSSGPNVVVSRMDGGWTPPLTVIRQPDMLLMRLSFMES